MHELGLLKKIKKRVGVGLNIKKCRNEQDYMKKQCLTWKRLIEAIGHGMMLPHGHSIGLRRCGKSI